MVLSDICIVIKYWDNEVINSRKFMKNKLSPYTCVRNLYSASISRYGAQSIRVENDLKDYLFLSPYFTCKNWDPKKLNGLIKNIF